MSDREDRKKLEQGELPFQVGKGLRDRQSGKHGVSDSKLGTWNTVVRAAQGNFDHLMETIRQVVRGHNSLVDDVSELQELIQGNLDTAGVGGGGSGGGSGAPGPAGSAGATGATGGSGAPGPPGSPGDDGADGALGPPGPVGAAGAQGVSGADAIGSQVNFPGQPGEEGEPGPIGPPGPPGPAGAAGGGTFAGARASRTNAQSFTTATEAAVSFDTEDIDTAGFVDIAGAPTKITIPAGEAGKYQFYGAARWGANATGVRYIALKKNGTTYLSLTDDSAPASGRRGMETTTGPISLVAKIGRAHV